MAGGRAPFTVTSDHSDVAIATVSVDGCKIVLKGVAASRPRVTVADKNGLHPPRN